LTPATPTKPGVRSDVSEGVVAAEGSKPMMRLIGGLPPSAECGRVAL